MRSIASRLLAFAAALALSLAPGLAAALPAFTPSVVDPGHVLDLAGTEAVNAELERIRVHGIVGAVYLVDTLDGLAIEDVAKEAIGEWQLGKASGDNGLLLVLAIRDRKSRIQVGRGLQGSISDAVASHALQQYVAPRMREGDVPGAIVDAFGYLARVVAQDPQALQETQPSGDQEFVWKRGLIAWGVMAAVVWLTMPIRNAWTWWRRRRLDRVEPGLLQDDGGLLGASIPGSGVAKKSIWFGFGIKLFLTVNPGVFVLLGSAFLREAYYASIAVSLIVMGLVITLPLRKFESPAAYRRFLGKRDKRRAALIAKGYLAQTSVGVFAYTQAYHQSMRDSSSSSSSDSSSSSSSSSSSDSSSSSGGSSGSW